MCNWGDTIKTPANYRYYEVITKTFLATTGQQSWKHENIFTKELIRRVIVVLCVGTTFIGTNTANPFIPSQKFGLREITIYRNDFATAGNPMSTTDNKRLYYNSMSALAYVENCLGLTLIEFANHFIMVFDLTSTPDATHNFIHPELTNSSLSVELKFDAALAHNVEIFFHGEKASTIYIDCARNASNKSSSHDHKLMEENQIHLQVKKCKPLKFKFRGVYAADNYPLNLQTNTFTFVHASRSNSFGTHWVVLAKRYAYPIMYYADPLALPLTTYNHIFNRLQ